MTKSIRTPIKGTPALENEADTPNPRSVREAAGLDLIEMAKLMGMGEFGYASWERGVRKPGGPAFQLLKVIDSDPQAALAALREKPGTS